MKACRCFVQTVGVLTVFALLRTFGLLGPSAVAMSLLTVTLALIAWRADATLADLGLRRTDVRAGLLYGAAAFLIIGLILAVVALIPATNGFWRDARAQISSGRLLLDLGVSVVLLTAIPEEFAFRGVLLGSALELWNGRRWQQWCASLITSALFGFWHIAPTLHTMSDNHEAKGVPLSLLVLINVAATFIAGLIFCWLRLKSKSLIAPVMAHAAFDGIALTIAWVTVHNGSLLSTL